VAEELPMNELSVAESIIDIAQRNARGRAIAKVQVRLGQLRQAAPESLDFAFNLLAEGTPLDGAELVVWYVSAAGRCRDCGAESVLEDFPLSCARCGGTDLDLFAGEELLVDALELKAELEPSGATPAAVR
jgi:hydrogenase nickel incorporation protein HypA/HybF